jgi:hypothetical protein
MALTEGFETSAKHNLTPGKFFIKPWKIDLTEGSETSAFFIQPLKINLTEGTETSTKLNLPPGKYSKENIPKNSYNYLKNMRSFCTILYIVCWSSTGKN